MAFAAGRRQEWTLGKIGFRKGRTGEAPTAGAAEPVASARPTLSELGSIDLRDTAPAPDPEAAGMPTSDDERAQRYAAWAERMHAKRQRVREQYRGEGGSDEATSYWTTDVLFEESRHVTERELFERPSARRVNELLAVLDLRDGATADDIGTAYRRLAKRHHPDRYVTAEADVQAFHEERMAAINAAYRALRSLEQV